MSLNPVHNLKTGHKIYLLGDILGNHTMNKRNLFEELKYVKKKYGS